MSKKRTKKQSRPAEARPQQELPKVTKRDLTAFDDMSKALILDAQERGARVRISNRGHAIIYGPNGGSASVPANSKSGNRSSQNSRAGVERLFR